MLADKIWMAVGFVGQGMFFTRFVVQWIASERKRQSVIPMPFWYFSIAGAAVSLVYAIHIQSWPFTLGQACGFVVYFRNLYLINRGKREVAA
ncbi:MAG TPA: lipid-A-disaccharide synthase N-terminal domain-containing protein [Alphaproteobacteria bacterium]|nr:lipid-A-disaccharide synthase N-terminal domain-containing protein [Alphaproteobacteria bacterium]